MREDGRKTNALGKCESKNKSAARSARHAQTEAKRKMDCDKGCENCKDRCANATFPKERPSEYSDIDRVIAVVSGKGGVGKSLVASLLACESNRRGHGTAIIDADITGASIPKIFGVFGRVSWGPEGIDPAISRDGIRIMSVAFALEDATSPVILRGPLIAQTVKQFWTEVRWGDIRNMFVDCPPGTGDVPLTVFQSLPVSGVVVVTSPQDLVEEIVGKAVKMARMLSVPILGLVQNMAYFECAACGARQYVFGKKDIVATAKAYGIPHFVELPILPFLAENCDRGLIEETSLPALSEFYSEAIES